MAVDKVGGGRTYVGGSTTCILKNAKIIITPVLEATRFVLEYS